VFTLSDECNPALKNAYLSIVIRLVGSFKISCEDKILEDKLNDSTLVYNQTLSTYEEVLASKEELKQTIYNYQNINESINETKKEFFDYAATLENKILNDETDLKIAYLTFDDGPYDLTYDFLEVLKNYDIQATFFELAKDTAIGKDVSGVYECVKEAGHTIGNHTYHHLIRKGLYYSVDSFINDVTLNREFIEDKLGITTDVLRFPGGSGRAGQLKNGIVDKLHELGYGYVDWDVECGDGYVKLSAAQYAKNILSTTNNQDIIVVLMHDYQQQTLVALPSIIEGLREQGYIFLPLWKDSVKVN